MYILQPIVRHCIAALALLTIAGCRNFNWAPTDALEKVSTTPPNTVVAPVFAPAGGSYNATQNVTLTTSTSGATICYRNDGTNADCDSATATCFAGSTTYVGSISVPASITLNAMACKATMNNSVIATAVYTIDSTAPVISAILPAAATYVTNTQVSYTLSESCGVGSITWTRTGGTADPGSPRVQSLVGAELTAGTHSSITLTNNPALVSGTVYDIAFNCTDAAGNAATTVTAAGVTFDNVVPVISGVAPTTGTFRTTTQVSYTLSEDCQTGNITWTRTGGVADGGSPHVQSLAGLELTAGTKTNITLGNNPALVSGTTYSVAFNCQDLAGQSATTVTSTGVTFDNVAPTISGVAPLDSAFVSTTQVSYDLTEVCASASITWARTGGSADGGSPHVQALTAGEMTAITHTNITITNNPTLVDGAIYSLDFNCTDAAGNVATTISRTNITYDPSAVVISAVSPASSSFRNNTQVSYTLSENCASGNVTWTRTAGNPDPGSPRVQALTGGELTAGTKANITLTNNPPLVDGAVYSVQFNCTDAAANASTPITVTNVTYDFTAPTISATAPAASAFVKDNLVSFTISENCASASITWTQTGGVADGSSPHAQPLTGAELNAGAHTGLFITNNPTLVSGAIYSMAFNCTDAATNAAPTITTTNVMFDDTPPTISIQNLRNNSTVHTGHVIGPAADNVAVTLVEFEFESNGTWNPATYGAGTYKFALPMGGTTWRDRTQHQIRVRASDAAGNITTTTSISVRKGNNRDVNGDGYGDVVVGAFKDTAYRGKVFIFHGSGAGITSVDTTTAARIIQGATMPAPTSRFGRNAALGDFNGDGFADVAVAATVYNGSQGATYIFHGGPGGITAIDTTAANQTIVGNGTEAFSSPLAAADINADGYSDLLAGAVSASASLGMAYLFYGGASGIATATSTAAPVKFQGEAATGQFSSSIVTGDFDNDGFSDVAIGAPAVSTNFGRAYLFYGTAGGFAPGTYTATFPGNTISTGAANNFMGGSMAAGDINGDGATDLVMGGYGAAASASLLRVFYGATSSRPLQNNTAPIATTITEVTNGVFFTTAIAISDTNSDGFEDVMVGAHGAAINAGYAAIFFGQAAPLSVTTPAAAGYMRTGLTAVGEQFARGLGTSDVNGDGYPDMLIGANFVSTDAGRAFIFHGAAGAPGMAANSTINGLAGSEFGISFAR